MVKESTIERYLVKRVKELGGEVRKVKWIGRRHAPDRLVMLPMLRTTRFNVRPRTVWVELKAPGETPRPGQLREHRRLRRLDQHVAVIDSKEGVDALLA